MADPSGWRAERGGTFFAFGDPSTATTTVSGPISFDSNGKRQPGNGNQSLEYDANAAQKPGVMIDESSDAAQPSAFQADACFAINDDDDSSLITGSVEVVFAFKDSDNYFAAGMTDSDKNSEAYIKEVQNGSQTELHGRQNLSSRPGTPGPWYFIRIQAAPVAGSDLRVVLSTTTLSDYQANGISALDTPIDKVLSSPTRQSGSVGLGYAHEQSGETCWFDGIEFYW